MKTQNELKALIEVARAQKKSGTLDGLTAKGDDASSTKSWGPQMRV